MQISPKAKRHLSGFLYGALAAIVSVNILFGTFGGHSVPLFAVDGWLYDRLLSLRPQGETKECPTIIVVDFGDDSFDLLKSIDPRLGQWPWWPDFFSQSIVNLKSLGATVIGIDKLFLDPHIMNDDDENVFQAEMDMAQRCREHGKVVLASKFQKRNVGGAETFFLRSPIFPFTDAEINTGIVNLPIDADNVIRRAQPFFESQGEIYPSFAAEVYRLYQDFPATEMSWNAEQSASLDELVFPLHNGNTFYIAYGDIKPDDHRFPVFPFAWFIDGPFKTIFGPDGIFSDSNAEDEFTVDLDIFKGSIVLMGASVPDLHDNYLTPIAHDMPGVEIHANALRTLFLGVPLKHVDDWLQVWGTFLLGLLLCLFCAVASIRAGIITSSVIILGLAVAAAMALIQWDYVTLIVTPAASLTLSVATTISYRYIAEEREKRYLKNLFAKATDAKLVEQLLENPELVRLGGDRREVSILFCDIRSFSTLSETMNPEVLIGLLNEYFTAVTETIFKNNGMIDKFIGDAVMAIFGAPLPMPDHAYWACKTAIDIHKVQTEVSKDWEEKGHQPFRIGIGLHTGLAVLGNLGSEKRSDYTCIGDAVNVSSRIEGLNKTYKTGILISENTYEACPDLLDVREVGEADIRGRSEKVRLYELLAVHEPPKQLISEDRTDGVNPASTQPNDDSNG